MQNKDFLIPLSIVAAGAMIGSGLYFGLRAQHPNRATGIQTMVKQPVDTKLAAPQAPVTSQTEVKQQAAELLDKQLASVSARCWPKAPNAELSKALRFMLNFTFAADGSPLARGFVALDRPENPELAANITRCVQDALAPVSIPPPGANTYIETPFQLP